ncbi:MAG: CARDB domain-containing protein [Chthoniobacterales bacterium]
MKIQFSLFLTVAALFTSLSTAKATTPAMADLVIEKTVQTSPTFWTVKVKNIGPIDSKPTMLKMVATPGGSYSCPVAAIKAGGTIDVPCRMPFKSQKDMRCEFILNPDKTVAEASYSNNRTTTLTNPKFN